MFSVTLNKNVSEKRFLMPKERQLTEDEQRELLATLQHRFDKFTERHEQMDWTNIEQKLLAQPKKLLSLYQMEQTGGEPDVVGIDEETGAYIFMDCSAETPKERRSVCYDRVALDARKKNKPETSALDLANGMGVTIATEDQYRFLQTKGEFDLKTSSWIATPDNIRKLGGALFCDRRYNTVFVYHNGADSYYSSRAFRGVLLV